MKLLMIGDATIQLDGQFRFYLFQFLDLGLQLIELLLLFEGKFPQNFKLIFVDPEGDSISLTTDEDLFSIIEAYPGVVEINVQTEEKAPVDMEIPFEKKFEAMKIEKDNEEEFSPEVIESAKIEQENPFQINNNNNQNNGNSNAVVHKGITCDGCGIKPIVGVRYKCAQCEDFDLCAVCEEKDTNHRHIFLKIKYPELGQVKTYSCYDEDIPKDVGFGDAKGIENLIKMAAPFLQTFKESFQGCVKKRNVFEEKAIKLTELVGGKLEDNLGLVKMFEEDYPIEKIVEMLMSK